MNIVCPLCGRHVPENVFDPTSFEPDIYGVEVVGLGRGKGFLVSKPFSILDNRYITDMIADRCKCILETIQPGTYLPKMEIDALQSDLETWTRYARKLEKENKKLKNEIDSYDLYCEELLEKINEETNFDFDDLEETVGFLLES